MNARSVIGPELTEARLGQRIVAAAELLMPDADLNVDLEPIDILDQVLQRATLNGQTTWLMLVALSTVYPSAPLVNEVRRELALANPGTRSEILLRVSLKLLNERGSPTASLVVVKDAWVVDVSHSAKFDSNTGIQRVVRNTMSQWVAGQRPVVLACWSEHDGSYRTLDPQEQSRVLHWDDRGCWPGAGAAPDTVVVPWQTTVVLPEVPTAWQCDVLAAVARYSGNRMVAIGHDCIPVLSADLLPQRESNKFVHYLALIKLIDRIATVSHSAAGEFEGFTTCLPTQGLVGPEVVACPLPVEVPHQDAANPVPKASPAMVTCVGSHEPRKNHMAVLFAAESLWREGLQFSLRFIGGKSWDDQGFEDWAHALQRQGRAVSLEHGVSDAELWQAYQQSRFTMFPSLHEGFGLPVAESIALGTPVITSNHGSTAEVAEGGGALLVDPGVDSDLVSAMRALLTDDVLLEKLAAETLARSRPTWRDYARSLWATFDQRVVDHDGSEQPVAGLSAPEHPMSGPRVPKQTVSQRSVFEQGGNR